MKSAGEFMFSFPDQPQTAQRRQPQTWRRFLPRDIPRNFKNSSYSFIHGHIILPVNQTATVSRGIKLDVRQGSRQQGLMVLWGTDNTVSELYKYWNSQHLKSAWSPVADTRRCWDLSERGFTQKLAQCCTLLDYALEFLTWSAHSGMRSSLRGVFLSCVPQCLMG